MDPLKLAEHRRDGRNVDPSLATLSGEGAGQRAVEPTAHPAPPSMALEPSAEREEEGRSYHGLPVLKEPVWKWMIPAYFFTGGLAGACAVLGAAAQVVAPDGTRVLVRRCRLAGLGGALASAALLIADLGRPARFLNMLRVFRPTSPMNMGTWVLTGFGALSGAAALPSVLTPANLRHRVLADRGPFRLARRRGPFEAAADAAGLGAGLLGLPLVGYTGVLLANTAVPVWQQTRNALPVLFAFSGAVSAGALFDLWPVPEPGATLARRFGLLAKGAELVTSFGLDGEARQVPRVAKPLQHGRSGALLRAARLLLLASAAVDVLGGRRGRRVAAGMLAMAGTLAMRFGIVAAGRQSARDPHASFEQQRAGRGAAELTGAPQNRSRLPPLAGMEPTGKEPHDDGSLARP
jgi:formate-dependent nitrite reductase membrane component NrfD